MTKKVAVFEWISLPEDIKQLIKKAYDWRWYNDISHYECNDLIPYEDLCNIEEYKSRVTKENNCKWDEWVDDFYLSEILLKLFELYPGEFVDYEAVVIEVSW